MAIKVEVNEEQTHATVDGVGYTAVPEIATGACLGCAFDAVIDRWEKPCSSLPCLSGERAGTRPVIWKEVKDV